MLELGILCVILLAAGYWATMFVMGRRADVLHGKFVHPEDGPETVDAAIAAPPMPGPPPFPKPPFPKPPFPKPPFPRRPVRAVQPANDTAERMDSAALQSLLAAIQQDLKGVA